VLRATFILLQFGFVIFWRNSINAKAARKMLMKLTAGFNFTNILQEDFLKGDLC